MIATLPQLAGTARADLVPAGDLVGWAALAVGLAVVLAVGLREPGVSLPLAVGYLARAALALVQRYVAALPFSYGEAEAFERLGWAWGRSGLSEALGHLTTGPDLYAWMIAVVYGVTGRSELLIQALNVLFGTLVVWNVHRVARELWGRRSALLAAWVVALFPTLVLFSAVTLREVAIVYPFTLGLVHLVRWTADRRTGDFLMVLAGFGVATLLNSGFMVALFVVGAWEAAAGLRGAWRLEPRSLRRAARAWPLLAVAAVGIVAGGWGLAKVGGQLSGLAPERLMALAEHRARGAAVYPGWLATYDAWWELVLLLPARLAYFFLAPFPWMIERPLDALAAGRIVLTLPLFWLVWRSRRRILASRSGRYVAIITAAVAVAFAAVVSNYGAATRHATKLVPALAVLISIEGRRVPGGAARRLLDGAVAGSREGQG